MKRTVFVLIFALLLNSFMINAGASERDEALGGDYSDSNGISIDSNADLSASETKAGYGTYTATNSILKYENFKNLAESTSKDWVSSYRKGELFFPWEISNLTTYVGGFRGSSATEVTQGLCNALYKGLRFKDSFTYSGTAAYAQNSMNIYFNAEPTVLATGEVVVRSGYRLVFDIKEKTVTLEKSEGASSWVKLHQVPTMLTTYQNIYFTIVYDNGSISFEGENDSGTTLLEFEDQSPLTHGFVGIGGYYSFASIKNVEVSYAPDNGYGNMQVEEISPSLTNFSVFNYQKPIEAYVKLNKSFNDVASVNLYIDNVFVDSLTFDGNKYVCKAISLAQGYHTKRIEATDIYNDKLVINLSDFYVKDYVIVPVGFKNSGNEIVGSIEEVEGDAVTAVFEHSYSKALMAMMCLYDEQNNLVEIAYSQPTSNRSELTMASLPQNLSGYTIKAFMFRDFENSAPMSGLFELK